MTDAEDVVVECELPDPPEKVWRALTVPELLAAWLMPNDIRPEVGSRFGFRAPDEAGDVACEVKAVEPHRRISYSWRSREEADNGAPATLLTFELTETEAGGTHLRLVHSGFAARLAPAVIPPRRRTTMLALRRARVSCMGERPSLTTMRLAA